MELLVWIVGVALSVALFVPGAWLLQRGSKVPGIALLVAGSVALLATIVIATVTSPIRLVETVEHQAEVISSSYGGRRLDLRLRDVETGQVYENVRLRGRGTSDECPSGRLRLRRGTRLTVKFNTYENGNNGERYTEPDASDLSRRYCTL